MTCFPIQLKCYCYSYVTTTTIIETIVEIYKDSCKMNGYGSLAIEKQLIDKNILIYTW